MASCGSTTQWRATFRWSIRPALASAGARRRWTSPTKGSSAFSCGIGMAHPFEHNAFRFHIRAPIFVVREWMRHRVGSFNEFSMRYAKATSDFYVPDAGRRQVAGRKAGRVLVRASRRGTRRADSGGAPGGLRPGVRDIERLVEAGVARELARSVMPVGAYTEFYWTVERASANELRLAARSGDSATGDPPLCRGRGGLPRRDDAGHARGIRRRGQSVAP